MRVALFLFLLLATACAHAPATSDDDSTRLLTQAQTFMTAYEVDLRTHDRAALGRRYHPDGAWFLGDGHKVHEAHAAIAARYAGKWKGPQHFAWRELTFVPLPPDAVLVLGKFEWHARDAAAPATYSYSALLRSTPAGLAIAMEDESTTDR